MQRKIGAAAAEQFREHLAEIDPHLRESFREQFLGRAVDPGDDVEHFAAGRDQIVVLRFEETVTLLEFVVFVHGIEVDRAHVVELAGQVRDDLLETSPRWWIWPLGGRDLAVADFGVPPSAVSGSCRLDPSARRLVTTLNVFWNAKVSVVNARRSIW